MNRRVNILQYVKTPAGRWQWAPIPRNPRTDAYIWSKAQSDQFYIVWRERGRRHYQKAGSTAAEALEAKRRKEFEILGRAVMSAPSADSRQDGISIEVAVADFLEFIKRKKRPQTLKRYRAVMDHFVKFFKPFRAVSNLTPGDIDAFRDERLAQLNPWGRPITPRNVNYEVATIRAFYYYLQKFRDPGTINPAARIKPLAVTKVAVDTYDEHELEKFFAACTPEESAVFKTFYYTGLRDQELAHLHWYDLNLSKGILTVHAKPDEGFVPKDWEERTIPIHPELMTILKELPRRHKRLIFPTMAGHPNGHLLRTLKEIVRRTELPGHWYLHKFRKTFATRALEKGADISTVQALLGHKNITTTARYLSTSTDKMREAVSKL
jgi:integrase/recombinase XerD